MTDEPEINERIERIIWRSAGIKSVRQIAQETGITEDEVLRIRERLKAEIDVLTVEQKQHKLLVALEEVLNDVRDRIDNVQDERNYAGIVNAFVSGTKAVNAELRAMEKRNTGAVESLNALRVRELLKLIDSAVAGTLSEIATTHALDVDELHGIFQGHLRPAAESLEA